MATQVECGWAGAVIKENYAFEQEQQSKIAHKRRKRMNGQMDRRLDRWTDSWMDGQTDGRTDGQMGGRIDIRTHKVGCRVACM